MALPSWDAFNEQVPAFSIETVKASTVQTSIVSDATETVSPDEAVGVRSNVVAVHARSARSANAIVWAMRVMSMSSAVGSDVPTYAPLPATSAPTCSVPVAPMVMVNVAVPLVPPGAMSNAATAGSTVAPWVAPESDVQPSPGAKPTTSPVIVTVTSIASPGCAEMGPVTLSTGVAALTVMPVVMAVAAA